MECLNAEKFGGYDAHFLEELSDEHECPICKMALRKPILTKCGHRLCLSCSEEMKKRKNGVLICPLDNNNLKPDQTFRDKAIERAVLQLKVKCNNFLKNCQWTGELKAINNHLGSCEYQEVECLNEQCSTLLLRKELSDHTETKCIYRLITCQHCNQEIRFCEKQGMRKEQDTHANSSTQNHLSMAISKVVALENKIMLTEKEMETKIAILKNEIEMRKEQHARVDFLTQNQFLTTSNMVELENKILLIEKEMEIKMVIPKNEKNFSFSIFQKVRTGLQKSTYADMGESGLIKNV
ncbi:TNF receptor-associated factor 6-B isoform X2 [Hydra vulgaris]|uniref:TNF receptor-associated factor 6-B isoform X2 n=1 Tax=Hydra vulgaris TaxID=6087 RepID=UPI001F5FB249|nr:TNF receptor-associated factor 6-B-like isoform X2 [Hydra vulgaris]